MEVILPILGILLINTVYLLSKFIVSLLFGIHESNMFIGYGKHEAFKFSIRKVTIYVGLFIPLPWLARFYSYNNGVKDRIKYEWEYYEKPWVIRLLVIFSGTLGALITSMIIFTILSYNEVDQFLTKDELNKYGIYPSSYAKEIGFEKGDKIIAINENSYDRYEELMAPNTLLGNTTYQIVRNQDTIRLGLNSDELVIQEFMLHLNAPCRINYLSPEGPASLAGLRIDDVITHIEGNEVNGMEEIKQNLQKVGGENIQINIRRDGQLDSLRIDVDKDGTIGFVGIPMVEYKTSRKSLVIALKEGFSTPLNLIALNLRGINQLVSGRTDVRKKNLSGPVRIASLFSNSYVRFFRISAMLLAFVAFWDFFPFPKSAMLKSLPIFWELVSKKKVSVQKFRNVQRVGWYIFTGIAAFVIINDIILLF